MTLISYIPTIEASFTFGDTNTPPATQWGSQFIGYIQKTGGSSKQRIPQGPLTASLLTNGSTQAVRFPGVTPGQSYDAFVSLADAQGNETPQVALFTNYAVPQLSSGGPIGRIIGPGHLYGGTDPSITEPISLKHIGDDPTTQRSAVLSSALTGNLPDLTKSGVLGAVPRKNLVVNGNNSNGTGAIVPSSYGWTNPFGAANNLTSNGLYGPYGSVHMMELASNPNGGFYQDVPCTPGQTCTFCAIVAAGTANANPGIWIGSADGNWNQWNNTLVPSVGSLGKFYINSTSSSNWLNTWVWQNASDVSSQVVLYGTFTAPASNASNAPFNTMRVMLYNSNNIGVALNCYYSGVMVIEGTRLQDYIDHELNAGGVHADRHVLDGTTRALVKTTELAGSSGAYTVKQLNDGTNTRTAAHLAHLINADNSAAQTTDWLPEGTNKYAAEHGADITGNHTANDTSKVNGVAAGTISQGASRANAAINSSNQVNYANTSSEYQGNYDSSGNAKKSSMFNSNLINTLANLTSNITVQFYSVSSGSLVAWVTSTINTSKSPGGSGYPDWEYPDNSGGIFPGHTNGYATVNGSGSLAPAKYWNGSSAVSMSWSGLGSAGVYILIGYNPTLDYYTIPYGPSTTAPGDDVVAAAQGDGSIVVALISASSSTVVHTSGGGGQPIGGGGGRPRD